MKIFIFAIISFIICQLNFAQGRIKYNNQDLFLNGANLAWVNFANDVGPGETNTEEFAEILLKIRDNGGNSLRLWLHTNGTNTPDFNADGEVIGAGVNTIDDLKNILDLAWEREVGIKICLWSFDMLRKNLSQTVKDRNRLLLTDTVYTNQYIENSLIPMVKSLAAHPAIIAWEIFNEPEGMSNEFGWGEIEHVSMSDIQKFVNLTAGAIHRADGTALVTNGCWNFKAQTDVQTSMDENINKLKNSSQENLNTLKNKINSQYKMNLTVAEVSANLKKQMKANNKNYYSDSELIAAGGDKDGILDFYSIHYYEHSGIATSPFHQNSNYWQLDKPIVVAEFHLKTTFGVPKEQLYNVLYQNGYAGAMAWSWTDNAVTQVNDICSSLSDLWEKYPTDIEVLGIAGDWPEIKFVSPIPDAHYDLDEDVLLVLEASDKDGSINKIEIFDYEDSLITTLVDEPYEYLWNNLEEGNYKIYAVATDNDGQSRKTDLVSFTYGELQFERFEAEASFIPGNGLSVKQDVSASNNSYVEFRTNIGNIKWKIQNEGEAGDYKIKFGYRLSFDTPKNQYIKVNGKLITELSFDGEVNKWLEKELSVPFNVGENEIEMELSWGWMDLDYLDIHKSIFTNIDESVSVPTTFELKQNYPNPFNPSTRIDFTIGKESIVKIIILDLLGEKIDELINKKLSAGSYSVNYDASKLTSGIYFYGLQTEKYSDFKKMILIK